MAAFALPIIYAFIVALLPLGIYSLYASTRHARVPLVNNFPGDYTGRKARSAYETNAKELIADGLAKHQGPIAPETIHGTKIILPPELSDWVKANKNLDHSAVVQDDFLYGFAGFEALEERPLDPLLHSQIAEALEEQWGHDRTWHAIDWFMGTSFIISRAAASVFVGPRLARDPEWQRVSLEYVLNYFTAVMQVRQWPVVLRPVAHYFNSVSNSCRRLLGEARTLLQAELDRRGSKADGEEYDDAIQWVTSAVGGREVDHAAFQLGLGVAALFTTAETLRSVLIEICGHRDIVPALREEIETAIALHGWTGAALFKMPLLDSVMKEAQRTTPALVGLERKAPCDVVLPDGTHLPKGTHIAVDSSLMWDPAVYRSPEAFNGRRYLEMPDSDPSRRFTSSSKEHNTFGLGRSICPGRFFADAELKVCLAQILLEYDVRFADGYSHKVAYSGFYPSIDPRARVKVRKREGEEGAST